MKKIAAVITMLILGMLAGCGSDSEEAGGESGSGGSDESVFKIGAIPDQDVSDLNRRFEEFADYLAEETGLDVEYVPSQDYAALVTAFKRGEVQLGWFGGLTGVQARNAVPEAEAIAQRPSDEEFHSVFITQKDSGINSLEDMEGKRFTFGSESSTSGHLMPRHFLNEAGIQPDEDFDGDVNYSGSHDKTWKLVESGAYQAGVLNEKVWESAVEEDKVDLEKVEAIHTTPAYYDYNWTINNVDETFGEGTKEKVKEALLSMGEEQGDILELFQTDSFIETKNENYKDIEKVAKKVGILK
ncbi:putative selenate ABC transporter substrate-binding protein [Bacillus marinisedimentorum]|uniref:putative selenate ABC transporter substrate-binding protein n=1 Tax=Bacillus marinisedimentorum TaxID=1821260 RepID=UPI0007E1F023|nr:putative selenate ABC transporter substrate-binding protein [Bacillus marinisedimentorum]